MLSPATYMVNSGKLARIPPHSMFYAPFLTDADIGGVPGPPLSTGPARTE
jgi:hypothetical protein